MNPRSEVTAKICGKDYVLRLTFGELAAIERDIPSHSVFSLIRDEIATGRASMTSLAIVLREAIKGGCGVILSTDEAGEMVRRSMNKNILATLSDVLISSLSDGDEKNAEAPTGPKKN
jgi:hypothetical protein